MAHAGGHDANEKFVAAWFAQLDLLELKRTVLRLDNCGRYLHD
jgi:hypothetical protein